MKIGYITPAGQNKGTVTFEPGELVDGALPGTKAIKRPDGTYVSIQGGQSPATKDISTSALLDQESFLVDGNRLVADRTNHGDKIYAILFTKAE